MRQLPLLSPLLHAGERNAAAAAHVVAASTEAIVELTRAREATQRLTADVAYRTARLPDVSFRDVNGNIRHRLIALLTYHGLDGACERGVGRTRLREVRLRTLERLSCGLTGGSHAALYERYRTFSVEVALQHLLHLVHKELSGRVSFGVYLLRNLAEDGPKSAAAAAAAAALAAANS